MARSLKEVPCIDPSTADPNLVDRLTGTGWKMAYSLLWRPSWNKIPFTQLDVERWCYLFRRGEELGGLGPAGHFRNYVDIRWGSSKAGSAKFVWHPWAEEMLEAACRTSFLGLAGGGGSGKSDFMAMWGVANWDIAPMDTKVLIITTTLKDAKSRIWGSIEKYFHAGQNMPGKLLSSFGLIRLQTDTIKPDVQRGLELFSADKKSFKEEDGSKIKGFHAPRVITLFDEMTDLAKASIVASANLMTNPWYHFIGSGNPASYFDAFGEFCEPAYGWENLEEDCKEWRTKKGGICLRFDSRESPNITLGKIKYPFLSTQEKIDAIASVHGGVNSPGYRSMVSAQFTAASNKDAIYSESDIVSTGGMQKAVFLGETTIVASLDPDFSDGGDGCALNFGRFGRAENNQKILEHYKTVLLYTDVRDKLTPRTKQICKQIVAHCKKEGVTPYHFAGDVTGGGSPFLDALAMEPGWDNTFLRVSFGGAASTGPVSVADKRKAKDVYANRVSELWHVAKSLLRSCQLRGISGTIAGQMTKRRLDKKVGDKDKIRVESKRDMKDRVGESPNEADAFMVMIDLCRTRLGFSPTERPGQEKKKPGSWRRKMERYNV